MAYHSTKDDWMNDADVDWRKSSEQKTMYERISIEELKNGFSELSESLIEFPIIFIYAAVTVVTVGSIEFGHRK